HVDASSDNEVVRALRAGFPPEQIQLTSQMPSPQLAEHLAHGVIFNACSLAQIERFGRAFPGGALGLRINPGHGSGGNNRTNVAGPAASFGIWHEHLAKARRIASRHRLHVRWAHHHVGSGGDPARWAAIAKTTLSFLDDLPEVDTINLGGGFKVARVPGEKSSDLSAAARETSGLLRAFAARTGRRLRLEIEPGTYLAANAGVIVARVVDVVDTGPRGHRFVKLDAGMAEILRPSLYGAQHPIRFVAASSRKALGAAKPLLVVGPCCESGDLLTPAPGDPEGLGERKLPVPAIGDLAVVGGAGAYCASMAAKNYNSIPAAPEVMRAADGKLRAVRRRQTLDDVLRDERA
ncbi:MAG: diaminopimelate decarboxylase, partial [Planctomycetes bacterium]|nr:diaminopimelate decarboxylase [Planctomycetota bacterium]